MTEVLNLDGMLGGRQIKRFKVTDGSHIFRILPPFGTNHNGVPSRQIQLHWGYSKKDGTKSPLPCSYPQEGHCPICDMVKSMTAEAEALYDTKTKKGDKESYDRIMKDAGEYKVRRTYLLNAANKKGEIGILEIVKTPMEELVKLMKAYANKYGKNPVSLTQGLWFVFSRSGKGFDTEYEVETSKKMVDLGGGEQAEKPDTDALPQNIVENYEKLAYDIHKMYPPVSSTDLAKIMAGAPVDEVVVKKDRNSRDQEAASTPASEDKPQTAGQRAQAKVAAATVAKAEATPPPAANVDAELDAVVGMLNQ